MVKMSPEKQPEWQRRYQRRTAARKCTQCGKPIAARGLLKCPECRKQLAEQTKAWRAKLRAAGKCVQCGKRKAAAGLIRCASCHVAKDAARISSAQALRTEVLTHYGHKCSCCGEPERDFLQIDHIHNDGAAHRKNDVSATNICRWLKNHNYPPGFQLLCANCNFAKGKYGSCPHKRKRNA